MRRWLLTAALVIAGSARLMAGDDPTICNDQTVHDAENIAACDRAIASGQISGTPLRDLYLSRGRHWTAARDADKAFSDFSQALQIDPGNTQLLDRVFISALAAGKIEDGVALARQVLDGDNTNRVAHLVLGVQAIKLKQYESAEPELRQSVRGPAAELVAALLSGWASYGAGDATAAVATIDKLSGPNWFPIFKDFHAGLIFDLANRAEDAGVRFERAYKRDGAALRVADAYARWLSRSRDAAAASTIYEAFDKKLPRNPLILEALRQLKAGGQLPALVDSPQAGAAEALYGVGASLARRGGEDLGLIYLQLALYLEPNDGLTLLSLADLYDSVKKPQLAIEVYRRVPRSSPFWRNAQMQIAVDLDAIDRTEEGRRILRALIGDDPKDLGAIVALGNLERGRKKFAECAQTYSSGIESLSGIEPANWTIFYFRGICLERSKQWPGAEADMRKALSLQPDQPLVLNYLGYSLIDQGLKTDEALTMIRRAVELRPDDGYIVDSLGWAHFRTGNLADGEKNLRRAVELKPADPTIHRHLGDLFWSEGLRSQAKAEWIEARRLNPEPNELAEIEGRIRDGLPDPSGVAQ